jgi:hypothetical protein
MAANYHHYQMAVHAAAAAAAAWREPDSPQLSFMSGCSSLFSISTLQDDDDGAVVIAGHALPSTPVSLAGFAGDEVDMEVQQISGGSGDDRRSIRMMRNRESALRSRARKRVSIQPCIYIRMNSLNYNTLYHVLSESSNLLSFLNKAHTDEMKLNPY